MVVWACVCLNLILRFRSRSALFSRTGWRLCVSSPRKESNATEEIRARESLNPCPIFPFFERCPRYIKAMDFNVACDVFTSPPPLGVGTQENLIFINTYL